MKLQQVKEYNKEELIKYNNGVLQLAFCGFRLPNGDFRKNGWVVSGYRGEDSHHFFNNKEKAIKFIINNK